MRSQKLEFSKPKAAEIPGARPWRGGNSEVRDLISLWGEVLCESRVREGLYLGRVTLPRLTRGQPLQTRGSGGRRVLAELTPWPCLSLATTLTSHQDSQGSAQAPALGVRAMTQSGDQQNFSENIKNIKHFKLYGLSDLCCNSSLYCCSVKAAVDIHNE